MQLFNWKYNLKRRAGYSGFTDWNGGLKLAMQMAFRGLQNCRGLFSLPVKRMSIYALTISRLLSGAY